MKELLVTIGLIILGTIIVSVFVIGNGNNSLKTATKNLSEKGVQAIQGVDWNVHE